MKEKIHKQDLRVQKNAKRTLLASFVFSDTPTRRFIIGILIIFVLGFGYGIIKMFSDDKKEVSVQTVVEDTVPLFYHPFTGAKLLKSFEESLHIFGVMIENAYDAWPLSGLEDAFLVIEAPVEGNIPRFLALFTSDVKSDQIGPVRSARPYYVDWAQGWNIIYAHVGGSPEALDLIDQLPIEDINEFYQSSVFWRSKQRSAPHNVYTSIDRLGTYANNHNIEKQKNGFFTFKNIAEKAGDKTRIAVQWYDEPSRYDAVWTLVNNMYERSQGSTMAKSTDGDVYRASNVIVMETDVRSIDAVDRKKIRTVGEGIVKIFQQGNVIEGIWKKEQDGKLQFFDIWQKEIEMLPGTTWIEVVDDIKSLTY